MSPREKAKILETLQRCLRRGQEGTAEQLLNQLAILALAVNIFPYPNSKICEYIRYKILRLRSPACEMQTPMLGRIAQKRHMVMGGRAWEYKGLYSLIGLWRVPGYGSNRNKG
jgi:hypothetical protein